MIYFTENMLFIKLTEKETRAIYFCSLNVSKAGQGRCDHLHFQYSALKKLMENLNTLLSKKLINSSFPMFSSLNNCKTKD